MTPPGANYPIAEHSVWFWLLYLSVVIIATFAMICLFLLAVSRDGQIRRPAEPAERAKEPRQVSAAPPVEHRAIKGAHPV